MGSAYSYDEQVGVTFTQDFSVLAFNVTAVQFTDSSGVGPGYLVNVTLVLLAIVLLVSQNRKRLTNGPNPSLRFCHGCGAELGLGAGICPACGLSTDTTTS